VHSRPFVGLIDELALYNRPLAIEEIQRHYELGSPHADRETGSQASESAADRRGSASAAADSVISPARRTPGSG
jgi:hypothetical protein